MDWRLGRRHCHHVIIRSQQHVRVVFVGTNLHHHSPRLIRPLCFISGSACTVACASIQRHGICFDCSVYFHSAISIVSPSLVLLYVLFPFSMSYLRVLFFVVYDWFFGVLSGCDISSTVGLGFFFSSFISFLQAQHFTASISASTQSVSESRRGYT